MKASNPELYLLLTDESNNVESTTSKFFICGGLIIPLSKVPILSDSLLKIKRQAGYKNSEVLKFNTKNKPLNSSIEKVKTAKKQVIKLCSEYQCTFISYIALHKIVGKNGETQKVTFALDHVLGRFQKYLAEKNSYGIVAVDSLPIDGQKKYLTEKHSNGLSLENSKIPLDRIKLFTSTYIGASNLSSMIDIVLGGFRYCINEPRNYDAANSLFKSISTLMWHDYPMGKLNFLEKGLIVRPKIESIKVVEYKNEYHNLLDNLRRLFHKDSE